MAGPRRFSAILMGGFPWRRMPVPQEALSFGPMSVLDRTLAAYREAQVQSIAIVLGFSDPQLERAISPHRSSVSTAVIEESSRSFGPYLKRGLELLRDQGDAIAIGLTDMPLLTGALVGSLFDEFRNSAKSIGVPLCQGILGHPVFFAAELRGQLERLSVQASYRGLIFSSGDEVLAIPTDYTAVLRTIESPTEYREMLTVAGLQPPEVRRPRAPKSPPAAAPNPETSQNRPAL